MSSSIGAYLFSVPFELGGPLDGNMVVSLFGERRSNAWFIEKARFSWTATSQYMLKALENDGNYLEDEEIPYSCTLTCPGHSFTFREFREKWMTTSKVEYLKWNVPFGTAIQCRFTVRTIENQVFWSDDFETLQ